jgi:hypothetical protein
MNRSWWVLAGMLAVAIVSLPLLPMPGEPQAAIKGSEGLTAPTMAVYLLDGSSERRIDGGDVVGTGAKLLIRYTLSEPAVVGLVVEEGKGGSLAWSSSSILPAGQHEVTLGGDSKPLVRKRDLTVAILLSKLDFQPVLYDLELLCGPEAPCAQFHARVR